MATIKDLLKANLVTGGTELIWKRRQAKQTHTALINANGTIITSDGAIHKTPSGAANKVDIVGFSLIRTGSAWTVLGQYSTYG